MAHFHGGHSNFCFRVLQVTREPWGRQVLLELRGTLGNQDLRDFEESQDQRWVTRLQKYSDKLMKLVDILDV